MTDKEKIAKSAANTWCRCFKCDGIVNSTHEKCEKDKLLTCHKWYDGYRTALLAISDYEQQLMAKAVDGIVHRFDGCGVESVHYNDPNGIPMAYFIPSEGLSAGDKVKIITIKED